MRDTCAIDQDANRKPSGIFALEFTVALYAADIDEISAAVAFPVPVSAVNVGLTVSSPEELHCVVKVLRRGVAKLGIQRMERKLTSVSEVSGGIAIATVTTERFGRCNTSLGKHRNFLVAEPLQDRWVVRSMTIDKLEDGPSILKAAGNLTSSHRCQATARPGISA